MLELQKLISLTRIKIKKQSYYMLMMHPLVWANHGTANWVIVTTVLTFSLKQLSNSCSNVGLSKLPILLAPPALLTCKSFYCVKYL